ncbi:MAG: hypothetical protein WCK18_17325 [Prolixibacteraceae bacterium]|jgi:hypothetical protein
MKNNLSYYNYGSQFKVGNNGLYSNLGYTNKPANSRIEYGREKCVSFKYEVRQVHIQYFKMSSIFD